MSKTNKRLVIIDSHALIHRAWHALPPTMRTKNGEIVNAVFGFTSTVLKMYKDLKPDYLAAAFDLAGPTFRHEAYGSYKATRVKQADELYEQIPRIREILSALNIPIFEAPGFEADDIVATIVRKHATSIETIIASGDLDLYQLIGDTVKIYNLRDGDLIDEQAVIKKMGGLTPKQIIDYKAIRGDASDNVPGVRGIGDKGAIKLLTDFGDLDTIYQNINSEKITARYRMLLTEHKDDAFLSRQICTLNDEAPIQFTLSNAEVKPINTDVVVPLFQELEFKSLITKLPLDLRTETIEKQINAETTVKAIADGAEYVLVDTPENLKKFVAAAKKQTTIAVDTETTGLNPFEDKLLGVSVSWQQDSAYYIVASEVARAALKPLLEDESIKKVGHNIKFDFQALRTAGIELKGVVFDTMIAAYLINPGNRQYSLDAMVFAEFGYQMQPISDLIGSGKKQISLADVAVARVSNYACEDADCTWRLYEVLSKQLKAKNAEKLFEEVELPLVFVLADMERRGILLDSKFLKKLSKQIGEELDILEATIQKIAGVEFNVASPKQLKEVLFDRLQISTQGLSKTKTGISTAASELEKMRGSHEIIDHILRYREIAKLKNTYLDSLPAQTDSHGRIHTSYNQTIAATGRLSSTDPNLQNIPVKTELGREIRKAFIAPDGFVIIAADYSQFELRIIASLSGDKKMIAAFNEGADIHTQTASDIFGVPQSKVTTEMRRTAKAINFGIIYGQGAWGLSETAGISRGDAMEFIDTYFSVYTGVKKYLEKTKEETRKNGFVQTMFGRRRYLPEINSSMQAVRAAAERAAVNHPIQGSQADLIKMAMIEVAKKLPTVSRDAGMLLQVHDELVFEVPTQEIQTVGAFIKTEMENIYKLKVPIVVTVSKGPSWGELSPL